MSKIAFIYPGQGAQKVGMGKDFYNEYKVAKEVFDNASKILGEDLTEICFEENSKINQTKYTQIAMLAVEIAITKVLEENNITPDITAGLSLGEYGAIAASSAVSYEDALRAVKVRGKLMDDAASDGIGAMSAILGLNGDQVNEAIADIKDISVANYNTEKQVVITGKKQNMEAAKAKLMEAGAKMCKDLNVSGPFHSSMLKEAGVELRQTLDQLEINNPSIPYIANVNAKIIKDNSEIKDLLEQQVSSSVMWFQSVQKLIAEGVDLFIEIGPSKTLSSMMKKIDRKAKVMNIETTEDLKKVLGEL